MEILPLIKKVILETFLSTKPLKTQSFANFMECSIKLILMIEIVVREEMYGIDSICSKYVVSWIETFQELYAGFVG